MTKTKTWALRLLAALTIITLFRLVWARYGTIQKPPQVQDSIEQVLNDTIRYEVIDRPDGSVQTRVKRRAGK